MAKSKITDNEEKFVLAEDHLETIASAMQDIVETAYDSAKAFKELKSISDNLQTQTGLIGTNLFNEDQLDRAKQLAKIIKEDFVNKIDFKRADMSDAFGQMVAYADDLIKHLEPTKKLHEKIIENFGITDFSSQVNELIQPFDKLYSKIEGMPFGSIIIKSLSLDNIKEEIEQKLTAVLSNALSSGEIGFIGLGKIALETIKTIGSGLFKLLMNPVVLAIGAVAGLAAMFVHAQHASREFLKATGLSAEGTHHLRAEIEDIGAELTKFGVSTEDAFNAAGAIYNEFGSIYAISKKMIGTVSKLAAGIGVSEDVSANVLSQFMAMSSGSEDIASNTAGIIVGLSQAAGVGAGDVFRDMAENSELTATYFKGSTKDLALAVVHAHRLGLNMSKVGSMLDSMMDFDSSIEKELEASLLLGKSINLNRARQLAFQGNIKGAVDETLKQIGSLDDFNRMNMFQKKAIAEAVGQTVADLENTLVTQQRLKDLTIDQKEEYENLVKQIESGKDLNGEMMLEQARQQVALDDMMNSFKAIGSSLSRIILPLVHAIAVPVGWIADIVSFIPDTINKLVGNTEEWYDSIIKVVGGILSAIIAFKVLKGVMFLINKTSSNIFGNLFGGASDTLKSGNFLTKSLKSISETLKGTVKSIGGILKEAVKSIGGGIKSFFGIFEKIKPTAILKFALVSAVLIGALYGLSFALKEFNNVDFSAALVGMGSLLALVGIMSIVGTIVSGVGPLLLIGAAAIVVLAGALWIIGKALQEVGKSLPYFSEFMSTISNIGSGILTAATGIGMLAASLAAFSIVAANAGIMSFFTADPVAQFERFAKIANQLDLAAESVERLKTSIAGFDKLSVEGLKNSIAQFEELDSSIEVLPKIGETAQKLNENISTSVESPDFVSEIRRSNTALEEKIQSIANAVSNMRVEIDGKIAGKVISKTIQSAYQT